MPQTTLRIPTRGRGLHEFTKELTRFVDTLGWRHESEPRDGLCTVFVRHTSASLVIQENADPSAKSDLERWFDRLVPDGDPFYRHTSEGPDDMPSHIKSALTSTSLGIPITSGSLALGTWQGVYLFEHRTMGSRRDVVVHVSS